ncbi:competence protein CoiA [Devosia sp.]|uniref:competence protein CoiA n=1 Tax=Devosia sp. TaxID=1871048 RepID=UPI003BAC33CD
MVGTCPVCGDPVLAKCGTMRVHHWAHRGTLACDAWWERELQWHRDWKNKFPITWQESIRLADDGEKHIADVRTEAGLVIEFQYSAIDPSERASRELFYGNMAWVVCGTRLLRDRTRFVENADLLSSMSKDFVYACHAPEKVFPRSWISSSVPVFFDFGSLEGKLDRLWCLLPYRVDRDAVVVAVSRAAFVKLASENAEILEAEKIANLVADMKRLAAMRQAQSYRMSAVLDAARYLRQPRFRRRF